MSHYRPTPVLVGTSLVLDAFGEPVEHGRRPLDAIVRVSRVGSRENLKSPEQQADDIRAWTRSNGFYVARIHREIDESGKTTDRRALNEAKARALSGEVDGLAAAYLSRFSRNVIQGLTLISDLRASDRLFVALDAPFDVNTPTGLMMVTVLLAIAQQQWETLRDGFDRNVGEAIKRGVHLAIPYGYGRSAGKGSPLAPVEAEAALVRRMFERRAEGWSWQRIADEANETGPAPRPWKAKKGEEPRAVIWTGHSVRSIVLGADGKGSRVYLGVAWNGGNREKLDAHPAIVDAELFARATDARGVKRIGSEVGYLLTSLVRCAGCGYAMTHTTERRKSAGGETVHRYYRCRPSQHRSGRCSAPAHVPAEEVERFVYEGFVERYLAVAAGLIETSDDLASAERAFEAAERGFESALAETKKLGDLSETEARIVRATLDEARAELRRSEEERNLARGRARGQMLPGNLDEDSMANLPVDEQRRHLASVFRVVVISAGSAPLARRVFVLGAHETPDGDDALRQWIAERDWNRSEATPPEASSEGGVDAL